MSRFTAEQFEDFARVAHDPECGTKVAAMLNGEAKPEDYEAVADSFREQFHPPRGTTAVMLASDVLLEGHGVEYIRDRDGHLIASYVNTGDIYASTLVFDIGRGTYEVTSTGDWIEAYEKEIGPVA